ncbi:MAG: glutamine-hydrolyzing carbamoyl-phosphate synthase small subunit [Alphaproteobacteria bacterium]|nr:glutamine-hydrolyzing carbamoyl-phosphate synthase small subunit [Alphaproteobacteria bacterium]
MTLNLDKKNIPEGVTAVLVLNDGNVFFGYGLGAETATVAEICFNTSITGYQEIMTDPSYAGQSITFTFPHIGNVGTNEEDFENIEPVARGAILRADISEPSNWRNMQDFDSWLKKYNIPAISGVDTRHVTANIRDNGAPHGVICHDKSGNFDLEKLYEQAKSWSGLKGLDLAKEVCCKKPYEWNETLWKLGNGYTESQDLKYHIVAIDYGIKRNILRNLSSQGCKITIVPATTSAQEILAYNPDGIFLSNGPGDPSATGKYAVPVIQELIASRKPIFGICLGHQMLALALGAKTEKMHLGHRGANHPIKDLTTGKVEITSQNHGFVVNKDNLPDNIEITHFSLFDGTLAGIAMKNQPVFSVQYHPEASPGPQDSHYLFKRFTDYLKAQ